MKSFIIYSITNKLDEIYIGITSMTLKQRMCAHKRDYKIGHKRKLYRSFELHGFENHTVHVINNVKVEPNQIKILEQIALFGIKKDKRLNTYKPHKRSLHNEMLLGIKS